MRYYVSGVSFAACTTTAATDELLRIWAGPSISPNTIWIITAMNLVNLFFAAD